MVDAWAVAAAVLIEEGNELHYNTITSRILDTGLSGLANKGKTPEQTLGVVLRKHEYGGRKVFKITGSGYYYLQDVEQAKRIPQVKQTLETLQRRRTPKQAAAGPPADELTLLRAEVKALKERNTALVAKLRQIATICGSGV